MATPFKFRYVNEIVGAFVLLTMALVIVSVVLIAFSKRWFTPTQTLSLKIPSEISTDLRPGTDVVIGGTVAGSVQYTTPDPIDPKLTVAVLSIPRNFMASVHADSKVEIRRMLGGVGDAYVKISQGTGLPVESGTSLTVSSVEANPTEIAQQTIVQIRDVAVPMLQSIRKIADDINDPRGNFQQSVAHANHIVASVDEGKGLAGRMLSDKELGDQVAAVVPKANAALADLQRVLHDTQQTTAQFPQMANSLNKDIEQLPAMLTELRGAIKQMSVILADVEKTTGLLPQTTRAVNQTMESIPGLVLQTQETLRQLQRLLEGAQKSWLLRSYVPQEVPAGGRISGDRVAQ